MSETSSDPGPWQVGEVYLVNNGSGAITGKLVSVGNIELVFDTRIGLLATELESCDRGDGYVIVVRNRVAFAERQGERR